MPQSRAKVVIHVGFRQSIFYRAPLGLLLLKIYSATLGRPTLRVGARQG